ncbi:MAG: YARHG domain-containing protein [Eubacterium sp.]|nr:YARHG domain-containing protein [Eubacterium sp.]
MEESEEVSEEDQNGDSGEEDSDLTGSSQGELSGDENGNHFSSSQEELSEEENKDYSENSQEKAGEEGSKDNSEDVFLVPGEETKSNKYEKVNKLTYTDSVRYTSEELKLLDRAGLRITRNEIFARHGRMFNDQELQKYFDNQPWYQPRYAPSDFDDSCLNAVEVYNVNLILECEQEQGYMQ